MKKAVALCGVSVFTIFFLMGTAMPARAQAVSGSVSYVTRYIWRGQDLLPNNDPALQPSFTVSLPHNVSFNVWGSYGFGGPRESNELYEMDYTVSVSKALSPLATLTAGHTYYTFHHVNAPHESQETFASVSFTKAPFRPVLALYGDWGSDVSRGYYANVSGSYDFILGRSKYKRPATFNASVGYCDGQWSMEPGFSDVNAGLSVPFKTAAKVTITPSITYTYVPEKASTAKGTTSPPKINTQNEFWGGVTAGFEF